MHHVLVTGVSSGIGYGIAREFLRKGYFVFGSVRTGHDAERLKRGLGPSFMPLVFDITDEEAVARAAETVSGVLEGRGLSGLINNAGIAESGPLMHATAEQLRRQFEVNVIGQVIVTREFLPLLGARKNCPHPPGKIFFISSSSGKIAHLFLGAYVGSKHAIEGMARVLRIELQLYGIPVVVIGPGAVASSIWDKESATSAAALYEKTDYGEAVKRFQSYFIASGKKGYDVDGFGARVVRIFEKKRNRFRYAVVKNVLKKWVLPRLMPSRAFDRKLGRAFELLPRSSTRKP